MALLAAKTGSAGEETHGASVRVSRFALILLVLLLLAGRAGAVDYYADDSGSNTTPYDTWAKAATNPASAITRGNTDADGEGPHRLFIAPATYANTSIVLTDSDWASSTIVGVSQAGVVADATGDDALIYPAAQGTVTISKTAGIALDVEVASVTVRNLTLTCTGTFNSLYVTAESFTGTNLYIYYTEAAVPARFVGATNFLLQRSRIESSATGQTGGISFLSGAAGTVQNCLVGSYQNGTAGTMRVINVATTGTINLYNNYVWGGPNSAVLVGDGTAVIKNCVLQAGSAGTDLSHTWCVERTGGTVILVTNDLIPHWYNHTITSGTIDTSIGNLTSAAPRWTSHARRGFIIPRVDDTTHLDYAQSLEAELASRGLKGTYYVSGAGVAANAAALQTMHDAGTMEVGGHGWSHSDLSLTTDAFSITEAAKTINVDRTGDQIIVSDTVTVSGFKAKTLTAIRTELTAGGVDALGDLTVKLSGDTLGESLADSSGAQASPYTCQLLIDTTAPIEGYFKVEIADTLAALESELTGYSAVTFATPYGGTSDGVRTAAQVLGWAGMGGAKKLGTYPLSAFNAYNLDYEIPEDFLTNGTPDVATLQQRTRDLCEWVAQEGIILSLLAHSEAECSISNWQTILDVMDDYAPDVTVTSFADALNTIQNSGDWSTVDNITYTRTWATPGDYHLLAGSPLIDVGTDLGTGTSYLDMDGENPDSYGSGWEIGAYQYPVYAGAVFRSAIFGGAVIR